MALAYLLKQQQLSIGLAGRVIKAADLRALSDAAEVIATCQSINEQVAAGAEEKYRAAWTRGFEHGRDEGMRRCGQTLAAIEQQTTRYFESLDRVMIGMVFDVVRHIAPKLGPQALLPQWIEQALAVVKAERYVRIRFHPDNRPTVQQCLDLARRAQPTVEFFELADDETLDPYAVVVESDCGSVRTDLDAQLAAMESAMLDCLAQEEQSPASSPAIATLAPGSDGAAVAVGTEADGGAVS